MRQVLSFQLDSCDIKPILYYDELALCCDDDDDDVSVFILIHIDADDDGIPLRMLMLSMKKTFDDL